MRAHKGAPPVGWENAPGMPGFIRQIQTKPMPGPQGEPGAAGPQGEPGPEGPQGPQGERGPQGEPGPAGPAGPAGAPGRDGRDGLDGKQGPRGERGTAGPAGRDGQDGTGIKRIVTHGADMEIELTDGRKTRHRLAGGSGTPFGGGQSPGPKGDPGEPGPAGPAGLAGASAYELAVANGFTGSEAEWLASLAGPAGEPGPGAAVPTTATTTFTVSAGTQVLFAEPIVMPAGTWIEVQPGAVLREVR